MIDKAVPAHAVVPDEDARALLIRLYREIGISAVAAALEVTAFGPQADEQPAGSRRTENEHTRKAGIAA